MSEEQLGIGAESEQGGTLSHGTRGSRIREIRQHDAMGEKEFSRYRSGCKWVTGRNRRTGAKAEYRTDRDVQEAGTDCGLGSTHGNNMRRGRRLALRHSAAQQTDEKGSVIEELSRANTALRH